jgi:hypothetical protein
MILYVNGDSHAAGTEAESPYGWAEDDGRFWKQGRHPHPDNEKVSFGAVLSDLLGCQRINQSQAGGSNPRIIRTTTQWIESNPEQLADTFMLIQWSTWEREEWLHDNVWYQVNASGVDHVPPVLEKRYRQYIIDIDYHSCTIQSHNKIWEFHQYLNTKGVKHLFFNGNSTFSDLAVQMVPDCRDWNNCYLGPYVRELSYNSVLLANGFPHVTSKNGHFGKEAHCFWANYVLQYINDNQLLGSDEIPSY